MPEIRVKKVITLKIYSRKKLTDNCC